LKMSTKVVAIVGSYRKGGMTDAAIEAILSGAREKGAETHAVYLADQKLEFCTSCRECALAPGPQRGRCPLKDDLEPILSEIEEADAVVLSSSVSYGNVTAIVHGAIDGLLLLAMGTAGTQASCQSMQPEGGTGGFVGNAGFFDSTSQRRSEHAAPDGKSAGIEAV